MKSGAEKFHESIKVKPSEKKEKKEKNNNNLTDREKKILESLKKAAGQR